MPEPSGPGIFHCIRFFVYCKRALIGTVYCIRTGFPRCFAGMNFGKSLITRMASSSISLSTPRAMVTLLTFQFFSITKLM